MLILCGKEKSGDWFLCSGGYGGPGEQAAQALNRRQRDPSTTSPPPPPHPPPTPTGPFAKPKTPRADRRAFFFDVSPTPFCRHDRRWTPHTRMSPPLARRLPSRDLSPSRVCHRPTPKRVCCGSPQGGRERVSLVLAIRRYERSPVETGCGETIGALFQHSATDTRLCCFFWRLGRGRSPPPPRSPKDISWARTLLAIR
jgi:hypothetical protein